MEKSKLIQLSISVKITKESLNKTSKSLAGLSLKRISVDPWYLIDHVTNLSSDEDTLGVFSNTANTRLFRRARNTLLDKFSSVEIKDGGIKAGPNPLKYDIFEYKLSIGGKL